MVPKGRTAKAWNDGLFRGTKVKADENIEIEYWTGKEIGARPPQEYLAEGYEMLNLNDEFLYYVLGEPNEFVYPTGERIYEQSTRWSCAAPSPWPSATPGRSSAAGSPSGATCRTRRPPGRWPTASGCRSWRPRRSCGNRRKPALSWAQFRELAKRTGSAG
ncbi:Family 20 glycosylhydrolase OS=Streptomyces cyaneofuscatus OX=66883 GN=G3I52_24390 PE=3 SV=1 [Streptomyces cyaneofuscatus]